MRTDLLLFYGVNLAHFLTPAEQIPNTVYSTKLYV